MGLFTDTVPRDLYDQKCAEYNDLLAKYHALRQTGAYAPQPTRTIAPPPEPEALAERRMVDGLADELAAHLSTIPGISQEAARAEADRIRREAFAPVGILPS